MKAERQGIKCNGATAVRKISGISTVHLQLFIS